MPKFAANLSTLFTELEFPDRFKAAADAGFKAVECQFPYAWDRHDLADRLAAHHLELVLHNLPAGDWEQGERGIACLPNRIGEFQQAVATAIEYATTLGCTRLNCLAGIPPPEADPRQVRDTFAANLRFAADRLKRAGIRLLIEPINNRDIPGFFLSATQQALDVIARTGSENVHLQYDVYHMQRTEGELAATIKRHLPRIAHIQIADNPGRGEPGTGEINYPFLFRWLDNIGYAGWVGCEYRPRSTTGESLGWFEPYRQTQP